jgi:hypothetical protein
MLQTKPWSACNAPCSTSATIAGFTSRQVTCVGNQQGVEAVVEEVHCTGSPKPLSTSPCAGPPCSAVFWQASNAWSSCSASCVANASDTASMGVSSRPPAVCMTSAGGNSSTPGVADGSVCLEAGLVRQCPCLPHSPHQVPCPYRVIRPPPHSISSPNFSAPASLRG